VRSERREIARLRADVGARRAIAARVRTRLDVPDATDDVSRLQASVELLTDELVGAQECLARLELRIADLTGAADREVARLGRLEDTVVAGLAAIVDPLREAGVAREILATSTWVERLPPSDVLVSIVLPTHDRPQQLREAIASVLEQTHQNFELLVVDDGSGPETAAVIRSYDDPRIRGFRRARNGGGGAARNIGLGRARGEYVTYLDDDNLIGRLWLRGLIWAFENAPACDVVYGAMSTDLEQQPDRMPILALHVWDRQQLLLRNFIDQGMIAHRVGMATASYDEPVSEAGDWDFIVRATRDRDAVRVPVVAVHYRTRHAGRISSGREMDVRVAATQQRFTRRGPLRVLVLDDESSAPGASPRATAEALERLGEHVIRCGEVRLEERGAGDADSTPLADAVRSVRPDLVLTPADPAIEAELRHLFTAYVAFAPGGTGERPTEGRVVSLGRWDGRTPFGVRDGGTALRGALLRELDLMHARWLDLPTPPDLAGDAVIPLVDTRDEPGLVTVVRDAVGVPASPAGVVVDG